MMIDPMKAGAMVFKVLLRIPQAALRLVENGYPSQRIEYFENATGYS